MPPAWPTRLPRLGHTQALVVTIAFCAAVTGYIATHDVAAATPSAESAIDTVAATIGVLLAYLLLGRFWESGRVGDLLLCGFLLLLGASNAAFAAVPRTFGHDGNSGAAAVAGLLAAATFLGATCLPAWRWTPRPRYAALLLVGGVGCALALAAAVALTGDEVGSTDTFGASPETALSLAQLVTAALLAVGALGSARRALEDPLFAWLAAAGLIAVGSRVDFAFSEAVGDRWFTAGTYLRVAFYLVLLVASAIEIRGYWRGRHRSPCSRSDGDWRAICTTALRRSSRSPQRRRGGWWRTRNTHGEPASSPQRLSGRWTSRGGRSLR